MQTGIIIIGEKKKTEEIGTTKRGIGPTYSDKMNRKFGIRIADLMDFSSFKEKLSFYNKLNYLDLPAALFMWFL